MFDKLIGIQKEKAIEAFNIFTKKYLVYLSGQERTGKSFVTCYILKRIINEFSKGKNTFIVVLTTKKGIDGWNKAFNLFDIGDDYKHIINYDQVRVAESGNKKDLLSKLNKSNIFVLDESHRYLSSVPNPSKTCIEVSKYTKNKGIIYCSATAFSQGIHQLYHQFFLSSYSPFKEFTNYHKFFSMYKNTPNKKIWTGSSSIDDYTDLKSGVVFDKCKNLFVSWTRKDMDLHEPEDKLHFIKLSKNTLDIAKNMVKGNSIELQLKDRCIYWRPSNAKNIFKIESSMKTVMGLSMLEGGVSIFEDDDEKRVYLSLPNKEKIDYILENWGDREDVAIMHHFKQEEFKLKDFFKKSSIFHSVKHAVAVDLHKFKHLIVYSQDFSASNYIQRRCRQVNNYRIDDITVHFLLVEGGVSQRVYEVVSKQSKNYTSKMYHNDINNNLLYL